jgi:hypothetical protein
MADGIVVAVVFIAAVAGGLARALLPYLRMLAAAEAEATEIPFQRRYLFTVTLAVVVSTILAVTVFPGLISNVPTDTDVAGLGGIFAYGFLATWGLNDVFNQIMSTGGLASKSETTVKSKIVTAKLPKDEQADPDAKLPIK